jgi:alkanesulfonate monooxygenase SsuD/methylene tetrahydromethanopterin reductase-like flavin-dependent oxidoreductase (luciferase family)
VTVLSSDDPIRVFQRFSTLDAISGGRAEVILGRGSFTESFPLFGYDLNRYHDLFEEKLELFAKVRQQQPVTWSGTTRVPLRDQVVYPPVEHGLLTTWVGVGGSPESVVRAARYGFQLMLAVVGGAPARFQPYIELFRRSLADFGHSMKPVGLHSIGHVSETDEQAREEYWPHFSEIANRIGKDRGFRPMTREIFDREVAQGALFIGSPETVAQKIAQTARTLDISRFDLKYGTPGLQREQVARTVELYGTKVIPRVRALLGESPQPALPALAFGS